MSNQSRMDAMADAETLVLVAPDAFESVVWGDFDTLEALHNSQRMGAAAALDMGDQPYDGWSARVGQERCAQAFARRAARAAFRAVPGLRG